MRPGSVIVDLAAETGGNCELTKPGEVVVEHGVTIIGLLNLPSTMPVHASQMYSKNVQNLLTPMLKDGRFAPDFNDEIVKGTCITRDGEIVHEATRQRLDLPSFEAAPAPEPVAAPVESSPPPEEQQTAAASDRVTIIDGTGEAGSAADEPSATSTAARPKTSGQ
jgi:NAD(P) transhydrogenase subunit alpha